MNPDLRLSASKIKALLDCSWKFYCNFILMLPEETHPRTLAGTLAHSILECLLNPRHKKHYDAIVSTPASVYNSEAVTRLIHRFQRKHNLSQEIIDDIDNMVLVGLTKINYFDEGCTKNFPPEHEFRIKLNSGGVVKGFIDKWAVYGNRALIRDYKSMKLLFTEDELDNNIQATMYQAYVMREHGLPADVEFIMLRWPPTAKEPTRHIQRVPAKTKEQIDGFFYYLEYMSGVFLNFGLQDAMQKYCADNPKKAYFCKYVCKFREPLDYIVRLDKDGKILSSHFTDAQLPQLGPDERFEERHYGGCPRFGGKL